jgi:hypothetical protein
MAPPEKEGSGGSGSTGTIAAVGIVCSFIGAAVGAVGFHLWNREKMQQQHQSHSGYVIHSRVKVGFRALLVSCGKFVVRIVWILNKIGREGDSSALGWMTSGGLLLTR